MKKKIILLVLVAVCSLVAPLAAQDVHSVVACKPMYLVDAETGQRFKQLSGCCSINWKQASRYGFFNAKISVEDSPIRLQYEFQLVAIGNCTKSQIEGIWDIYRNGLVVASGIVGKLYGLDQPIGQYFKFYGGDSSCYGEKWHVSAYITERTDY